LSLEGSTAGGNTTCLTVEFEDKLIIFDAGSGIRELGDYLMSGKDERVRNFGFSRGKGQAYLFFTHTHWDHIQGLPFFKPIHVPGNLFDIYHVHDHVPQTLARQMEAVFFPLQFDQIGATLRFHRLQEGQQLKLGNMVISTIELKHPGKAYAYRIEADNAIAILATDGEYQSLDNTDTLKYRNFYANADALIFDAMFSVRESFVKQDWGHSSALIGADIAAEAHVRRLFLFHHDPATTDTELLQILRETEEYIERVGSSLEVVVAQEGLEIELSHPTIEAEFHIEDRLEHGVIFMSLSGKFGGQATERFRMHLARSLQSYQTDKVIIKMDGLTELHMAGIRALLDARGTVMGLALVGVPENIYRVIELSATTDFFAIYDDDESALKALNFKE
jgi:phosphoribosyl 1,2-cyclic phosphodiesterase/anti-anti-sigma regulatory factor